MANPITSESMLEQMANAWWRVATTLDQVRPGWDSKEPGLVNVDAACAAIREMSSRPIPSTTQEQSK